MIKQVSYRLSLSILLAFACLPGRSLAQWASGKALSISTESHWHAFAMDSSGNQYVAGISDRMPQPNPRAFVVVKYGKDTAKAWDGRFYGPTTISNHVELGVDADGDVYAIYVFKGTLTRPDSTQITSVAEACLIVKFDSKGKHLWSKRLGVGEFTSFKVHGDGTLGVHIPNFTAANGVTWGDTTFNLPAGDGFLEISGDGALLSVTGINALSASAGAPFRWVDSPAPGKLRVALGEASTFANTPNFLKLADIDLATKAVTAKPDSAKFTRTLSGGITLEQFFYEEKTGHLFLLTNAREGTVKVNDKDSLAPWINNLSKVYHLLEFNGKMELINRFMHTNPRMYAVRDSQIVIQALVHRNAGFLSDHGTIAAKGPTDGQITYVIDRSLKYKRKALVECPASGNSNVSPADLHIDAQGEIFLGLEAGYTLNYPRARDVLTFPAPLATSAAIFVVSRMGDSTVVGIRENRRGFRSPQARLRYGPAGSSVRIERMGAFRYELTDLSGKALRRGDGIGSAVCDLSRVAPGSYLVRIEAGGLRETLPLTVE